MKYFGRTSTTMRQSPSGRHLDVLGVERAVVALRPRRVPLGRAGDGERHGSSRGRRVCRRQGRPEHGSGPTEREPLLDEVGVEAPVEPRDRVVDLDPADVGHGCLRRAARDDEADRPWTAHSSPARPVARDDAPSGPSHDCSVRTRRRTRRGVAPRSLRSRPGSTSGSGRVAAPRLTRSDHAESVALERGLPVAGVCEATRPAGTNSEYVLDPTVTGACAASR